MMDSRSGATRSPVDDAALGGTDLVGRHPRGGDVAQLEQPFAVVDERRLTGREGEPEVSGFVVPRHAGSGEVQLSEFVLRPHIVAVRSAPVPARGFARVGSDAPALAVEIADDTLRGSATVVCRPPVPFERQPFILRDAEAEVEELSQLKFRVGIALRGGLAQPIHCQGQIRAAVIEQRAKRELRNDIAAGGARTRRRKGALDILINLRGRRDRRHTAQDDGEQHTRHMYWWRYQQRASGWSRLYRPCALALALGALLPPPSAAVFAQATAVDVVYVPTPQPVVEALLELAGVTRDDVVYDLGSGDGRIVITAAKKYGARGVGVELDPGLVRKATDNAAAEGVSDRVRFVTQNLFDADIREASVVTLYLLQSINERLRPKLIRELKPGTRIVSHVFNMGPEWPPQQTRMVGPSRLFFWTIERP